MIVSHKHKFIFIKTVKTAGTSVEIELNRVLGSDDIATPIIPAVYGHKPQNHLYKKFRVLPRRMKNHMRAVEVLDSIGREVFESYFVFCIEREPIDKCLSHYSMLKNSPMHNRGNKSLTIDSYIERGKFPVDTPKYIDGAGNLIVHKILRYENIADELQEIGNMLGFNVDLKSKAKSGFREKLSLRTPQKLKIYEAFESSNRYTGYKL
jgi:hypothetical protein